MGINLDDGYNELLEHNGHEIVIVTYNNHTTKEVVNVSLECETCQCVLLDFDNPESEVIKKLRESGIKNKQ